MLLTQQHLVLKRLSFEQVIYITFDIVVLLLANNMGVTFEEVESRHRNVE